MPFLLYLRLTFLLSIIQLHRISVNSLVIEVEQKALLERIDKHNFKYY